MILYYAHIYHWLILAMAMTRIQQGLRGIAALRETVRNLLCWGITTTAVKDFSSFISVGRIPALDDKTKLKQNSTLGAMTDSYNDLSQWAMDNSPSSSNNKKWFLAARVFYRNTYADGFASQATFSRLLDRCFLDRTKVELGLILFCDYDAAGWSFRWWWKRSDDDDAGICTRILLNVFEESLISWRKLAVLPCPCVGLSSDDIFPCFSHNFQLRV